MNPFRWFVIWFTVISLFFLVCAGTLGVLAVIRQPHTTPIMRGRMTAERMGCFSCHGVEGGTGVPNPGSLEGRVPSFSGGATLMFYIQNENEIRDWILYGAPRRGTENTQDPSQGGLIRMPAYQGLLPDAELEDLITYVKHAASYERPVHEEVERGRQTAHDLGCLHCHGVEGQGGSSNPGSFKGYIPPWDSKDFHEVVKNDDELREWILDGKIHRFESNSVARYFTRGQVIQMPAYRGILKPEELNALVTYIRWLGEKGPKTQASWTDPDAVWKTPRVERGRRLYREAGCVTCHGLDGRGGVGNPNYAGGTVPSLNDLAEKMELHEKDQADRVISLLEKRANLEELDGAMLTRYRDLRDMILKGSAGVRKDPSKEPPPMQMPAWRYRLNADNTPGSEVDVDAIIAYLLTLQSWEK